MKLSAEDRMQELVAKVKGYIADEEGWKVVKKSEETERNINVWCKPSDEFAGHVFKGVGVLDVSPETCFKYCDPKPDGKRVKWDKAIKELEVMEYLRKDDPEMYVLRTMTHNAAFGLISPRDFVDVVVNINNDEFVGTLAHNIETEQAPSTAEYVRGTNYYCGILCYRIPGELNKTKVYYIAQSDIGGLLPRSLVESTLPNAVMDFFTNIKRQIEEDGCNEFSF